MEAVAYWFRWYREEVINAYLPANQSVVVRGLIFAVMFCTSLMFLPIVVVGGLVSFLPGIGLVSYPFVLVASLYVLWQNIHQAFLTPVQTGPRPKVRLR